MSTSFDQEDLQNIFSKFEAVLQEMDIIDRQVQDSLHLVKEKTVTTQRLLQESEKSITTGKTSANQKLAALIKQAKL